MDTLVIPFIGETLSLATAVIWALAVVLFKKSGETVHPIGLNLFKNLVGMVLFIPTIWLFGDTIFQDSPFRDYLILLLSGAIGIGIADTLFFQCLNRLGAGLTAIIDCLYAPMTIALSMIWLGESLTVWQIIGAVVIISAVLTATYKDNKEYVDWKNLLLGTLYGVLAMALMAIGVVMMKPVLNNNPVMWVTEIRLFGGIIVLLIVLLFHPKRIKIVKSIIDTKGIKYTITSSVVGAYLAMMCWIGGMKFTQTSIAAALNQTNNIFIFIFAAIILKEKLDLKKTLGIILAVWGTFMVTFG